MKRKEDLFNLIMAMSKSEKRYFTLDAQKSGKKGSKYLDLFQAINALDEYDEEKLKKKFSKTLHVDKSYLYEAILRSMRDYRSATSRTARIKEMILDYKYLYERGLFDQGEERLKEARESATQFGNALALLEINAEERRLVRMTKKKNYGEEIIHYISECRNYLHQAEEFFTFMNISDEIFAELLSHFKYRQEEDKQKLQEKFPADLFLIENKPENIQAQRRFFLSGLLYFQLLGEEEKMLDFYSTIVAWWDSHPLLKEEEFDWYVNDIANYLHALFRLNRFEPISEILQNLEKEIPGNVHYQELLFQRITIYRLLYFINIGNRAEGKKLMDEVRKGLQKFKIRLAARMVLMFNCAVLAFLLQDYPYCIHWCEQILKEVKDNTRLDIQIGIRLIHLFATFELEEVEAFELLYRNTMRYYTQNLSLNKDSFELHACKTLFKIYQSPLKEQKQLFKTFKEKLENSVADEHSSVAMDLDDLLLKWVQRKV